MKPSDVIEFNDLKSEYSNSPAGIRKSASPSSGQGGICNRIIQNAKPSICFYSHTPEGVFTFLSPSAEKIFGFTPQEGIGKNWRDILILSDETLANVDAYDKACLRGEIPSPYDAEICHPKRGSIILEVQDGPVFDENGHVMAIEGFVVDVTELRSFQRELENLVRIRTKEARLARERMFHAAKMVSLGTVVSGVAHEINNPISFVMLNAPALNKIWSDLVPVMTDYKNRHGMLEAGGFSFAELIEDVPDMLDLIHQAAQRIKGIVGDLKSYSRQTPTNLDERIDINRVVERSIKFTHNLIAKATDRFSANLGRGIPPFKGNSLRIEQVLINLLVNACEALADRNRAITINTAFDNSQGKVICRVRDEGEGVSEENLRQLTDPFFTTKRDTGGTGLGLSVSAGIVEMHGGSIDIVPNPEKGITVILGFAADDAP